jgi:hypothetical protein
MCSQPRESKGPEREGKMNELTSDPHIGTEEEKLYKQGLGI